MGNKTRTIAIVDDDDTVRDSLRALLETHGCTVYDFADGESFLRRGPELSADCVLLDLHMPGKTGLDVLQELRANGNMIPVIIITGRNDRLLEARIQSVAQVTILDKPVAQARLFAATEDALKPR